jgi:MFS family permease
MSSLAAPRRQTFRSLRNRNYRLYFVGQSLSSSGTWVQLVAENWLVIRLGGGGLALGITTALQFTPLLLFGPLAGVTVDRWNPRRLLILTQSANGLLAASLASLALGHVVQIWMVWVAAFLVGCVNSLDNPGRQTLTKQMVGQESVANAVALNTAISNAARAVGPAIGGLLLAAFGVSACFLVNAASYALVVLALRAMHGDELSAAPPVGRRRGQLREGLAYVRERPALWTTLLVVGLVSTFGLNYQVVLPVLVSHTFHHGPAAYGIVMSVLGIGSVAGAIVAAGRGDPTLRRVGLLAVAFAIVSAGVAAAPTIVVAAAVVGFMGIVSGSFLSAATGSLQLNAADEFRGRVMSLYYVAFLGVSPFSGPLVGSVAQFLGPRAAFWLAAAACAASGAVPALVARRVKDEAEETPDSRARRTTRSATPSA